MSEEQQRNVGPIRSDSVAISYETRKGLRYVSRALGMPNADALAEQVLSSWLAKTYPQVTGHIEDLDEAETTFEATLKKNLSPVPF